MFPYLVAVSADGEMFERCPGTLSIRFGVF